MKSKTIYRVRNWPEYDQALCQRGSLTFWVSEDVVRNWKMVGKSGQRGASRLYSDVAIETMASLRVLLHLPGRACEGFLRSLFELMHLDLPVPDHSTLSRRLADLDIQIPRHLAQSAGALHVLIDSSGFKVLGEGEWKVRVHGKGKRRKWLKLHLSVDGNTGEVVAALTTVATCGDAPQVADLLDQIETPIAQVSADGAYDAAHVYREVCARGARATIPPRKGAKIWFDRRSPGNKEVRHDRDQNLRTIRKKGKAAWKRDSGYSKRSNIESTFSRDKRCLGDKLHSRTEPNGLAELLLHPVLLNKMWHLGQPKTEAVTL